MKIDLDATTLVMLAEWVKHSKAEPEVLTEDQVHVEHLRRQMDEWQRQEDAWWLLIGARLARAALEVALAAEQPEER